MIRLSRREDYAIILINELVKAYNKRLVPLSEVAKEYNLSVLFLRNLAGDLRSTGIIKAVEGKSGGYFLTKDPKDIKTGEVLRVFAKEQSLTCCSNDSKDPSAGSGQEDHNRVCPQKGHCAAGNIWRKLNKELMDKVYNLSLSEFLRQAK